MKYFQSTPSIIYLLQGSSRNSKLRIRFSLQNSFPDISFSKRKEKTQQCHYLIHYVPSSLPFCLLYLSYLLTLLSLDNIYSFIFCVLYLHKPFQYTLPHLWCFFFLVRGMPSSNEAMGVCLSNLITENKNYRQFNRSNARNSTTVSIYIHASLPYHELVEEQRHRHQHIPYCIHAYMSYILRMTTISRMKLNSSTNTSICITFYSIQI